MAINQLRHRLARAWLPPIFAILLLRFSSTMLFGQDADWDKYMDTGKRAMAGQHYPEAEQAYRKAWEVAVKRWKHDARISGALLRSAEACSAQGKQGDAILFANQSVAALDQALKVHKPKDATEEYQQAEVSADAIDKAGDVLSASREYSTAEVMYKRVVAIRERAAAEPKATRKHANEDFFRFLLQSSGDERSKLVDARDKLANFYFAQHKFEAAIPVYESSVKIKEGQYGTSSLPVASSLSSLASCYASLGQYDKAEPVFKRVIGILEQAGWHDKTEMAIALENYALMLRKAHRDEDAAPVSERARVIRGKFAPTPQ